MMVPDNKRRARRKKTAEDFTPDPLVLEMLNKLPKDMWRVGENVL